jgi:hypothetical protein
VGARADRGASFDAPPKRIGVETTEGEGAADFAFECRFSCPLPVCAVSCCFPVERFTGAGESNSIGL